VSAQVQVRNQTNLLTRLHALEYLVANGGARTAQATNGGVLIVPRPIGLFRRNVLDEVSRHYFAGAGGGGTAEGTGPFSRHTFAEDFELSVMISALGYDIAYEPEAVSLTTAPDTMPSLLNQPYRWLRGSMQVAARFHREGWGRRTGSRALRWWMTMSTTAELYIVPVACLLLLATLAWTVWMGELTSILALWMLLWGIHMCTAAIFIRSHGERLSLALLAPMHSLYGAFLLTGAWLLAVWDETAARPMRW
jgi:cellulose synthase/poly-beta-1,6-N-acetylglucosamine synthase-like glycosyltransferase